MIYLINSLALVGVLLIAGVGYAAVSGTLTRTHLRSTTGVLALLGIIILILSLAGCAAPYAFVEGRDYRVDQDTRTLYTRSAAVAEAICTQRGANYATYRARFVGGARAGDAPGSAFSSSAMAPSGAGCYDPRDDVIIVEEHNPVAEAHERKHRREGAWHD